MKTKTILLLVGGLLLVSALAVVALLVPVNQVGKQENAVTTSVDRPTESTTAEQPAEAVATEPQKEALSMEQTTSTVTFAAADGLTVTADLYWTGDQTAPFIILFHQADYSRGEYLEIAPKLNAMGYNCLAVDQRSGGQTNDILNETYRAAKAEGLPTGYADAYPDLEAALSYVIQQFAPDQLIVWGSSYSSSLVLILASEHPGEIDAVLSFSPGEYFQYNGKKVADYAAKITQPVFITSAKSEEKSWRGIADQITSSSSVFFVPQGNGRHGSSTLFEKTSNNAEYWTAVSDFLSALNAS